MAVCALNHRAENRLMAIGGRLENHLGEHAPGSRMKGEEPTIWREFRI